MKLDSLQAIVWRDLPLRKRLAGRRVVDDLVQLSIESWPVDYMNHAADDAERRIVAMEIERSVKRLYTACSATDAVTMGILWTFVLQALVSLIVERILRWWQESRANRVFLVAMKSELTA
jgi:hypothetical protein